MYFGLYGAALQVDSRDPRSPGTVRVIGSCCEMTTQMKVLREERIASAGHFAAESRKGQVLRIIDVEGQQVADLVTINAGDLAEKLSVMNTINLNKQVFPRVGYVLYSDEARGMMTIIADHCGVHDMLAGACSSFPNEKRYGVKESKSRADTLAPSLNPLALYR